MPPFRSLIMYKLLLLLVDIFETHWQALPSHKTFQIIKISTNLSSNLQTSFELSPCIGVNRKDDQTVLKDNATFYVNVLIITHLSVLHAIHTSRNCGVIAWRLWNGWWKIPETEHSEITLLNITRFPWQLLFKIRHKKVHILPRKHLLRWERI